MKFRAFIADEFMAYTDNNEHPDIQFVIGIDGLKVHTFDLIDKCEGGEHYQNEEWLEHSEYPIMQYSEVRDYNREEIYEYDLVTASTHEKEEGVYVVVNYGGAFRLVDYRSELDEYDDYEGDYYYYHNDLVSDIRKVQLLGNFFEDIDDVNELVENRDKAEKEQKVIDEAELLKHIIENEPSF